MTARELIRRLLAGELSAVEALTDQLDRIERLNPALTAVVSLDPDRGFEQAKAADALAEAERGPLHGVPMTLKDGHDVAGLRTTLGSRELDRVADADGTVAARLKQAGAVIAGHTNVPPYLADYQSANEIFGRTNNPWDTTRTAGGSSGGAAAALAAGLTPLEYGSDLAGSLRLPAAFCGVYGLKTTEHRVPLTGFFHLPGVPRSVRIMSSLGPMACDLDDLELALRLTAGPDGADLDVPPVSLPRARPRAVDELRLAVVPALPGATVSRAVRTAVERVAATASDAGARVVERLPEVDWDRLHEVYGGLLGAVTQIFAPGAELSDEQRSLAWYLAALDERDRLAASFERYFSEVDALVLPATMTTAFPHTDGSVADVDGQQVRYDAHGHPLVFANLTGQPALAVPAGLDDGGLPVGVQLVGPRWSELDLLDVARALESAEVLPGFVPPAI
ncbi:MAG: amidase [Kribbellaceae bacterium]